MTQEKFREVLDEKRYSYEMEGNKIVVTSNGYADLNALTSLPPGVEFKNRGHINLKSLMDGFFNDWKGNIKGIDSKRLLNKMISLGLFER